MASNGPAGTGKASARQDHDLVTLGIAFAAIILFVGTAGIVVPNLVKAWNGQAASPDVALSNALLLNIALILLGWNRYKALTEELRTRRVSEEEARRLAEIDHLTGCHNRRSFTGVLADLLVGLERRERALAAIAIDLDNFKALNDEHGHAKGDSVLKDVAAQIVGALRPSDVVCRYGGEELLVILPDCGTDDAMMRAEQVRARIEMLSDQHGCSVAASIGVASLPDTAKTASDLLTASDHALYEAKALGKNRVQAAQPVVKIVQESDPASPRLVVS